MPNFTACDSNELKYFSYSVTIYLNSIDFFLGNTAHPENLPRRGDGQPSTDSELGFCVRLCQHRWTNLQVWKALPLSIRICSAAQGRWEDNSELQFETEKAT